MTINKLYLAAAISLALTACGSDSDSGSSTTPSPQNPSDPSDPTLPLPVVPDVELITVKAIDGYLMGADVYNSSCSSKLGTTNENGVAIIDKNLVDGTICVKATPSTFDTGRQAYVKAPFEMMAHEDSEVITPITTLVVEQMEQNSSLTIEEAEANVVEAVSHGETAVSSDVLFGDYANSDDTEAQAVELLAETLVDMETSEDTAGMSIEEKLVVTETIAEEITEEVIDNDGELPAEFAPVVDENGGVSTNYKPSIVEGTVMPSDTYMQIIPNTPTPLAPISVTEWFEDKDGDQLTYSVETISESGSNIVSNVKPEEGDETNVNAIWVNESGYIVGLLSFADEYTVRVYASDAKTTSMPVAFEIYAHSINRAPQIDEAVKAQVEVELLELNFIANEEIAEGTSVSIDGLFTDPDGDLLSYSVEDDTNADIEVHGSELKFSGAFNSGDVGSNELILTARDDGDMVQETFTINVQKAIVVNNPPTVVSGAETAIGNEVLSWELTEREALTETLDVSHLFTDVDGDILDFHATSSLETHETTGAETGFKVEVNENGIISFIGYIPRAGQGEFITVQSTDGKDFSETVTFALPEITEHQGASDPLEDASALEDSTWFFVEYGSSYVDGDYQYNKNWCDAVHFDSASKLMYWNKRTVDDALQCSKVDFTNPSQFEEVGSYYIDGNKILVQFENEANNFVYKAVEVHNVLGGSITLRQNIENYPASEAESWIASTSTDETEKALSFAYSDETKEIEGGYITEILDGVYGNVEVFINEMGATNYQPMVQIEPMTCTQLKANYYNFELNTDTTSNVGQCNDVGENEVAITFTVDLSDEEVNSIIGRSRVYTNPDIKLNVVR